MDWGKRVWIWAGIILGSQVAQAAAQYSVEIDLQRQTAYLISGNRVVLASPVSSGRSGHLTETGSFKIVEKERNHYSSLYGKIVDASGRTVVSDADADMKVPRGGRFIPAPMRYFMRFHVRPECMGYLPGYPASHGCVRMPEQNAIQFFAAIEVGTPVHVFGSTPRTAITLSTVRNLHGDHPTIAVMIRDTILASIHVLEIRVTTRGMRRRQIGGAIKD